MSKSKTPNAANLETLWAQWENPINSSLSLQNLSIRSSSIQQDSGEKLMYSTKTTRQVKLALYKFIIDFYHQETNDRVFKKRWEELHDQALVEIGLEKRLESGIKGKDSANVKYKENNWFGAMYTYVIAWGCLIPYHPDDMTDDDPKKKQIASLEAAIWSNIAACAVTAHTDKKLEKAQLPIVNQIGLKAVRICLTMKELATVGIIKKCCNRGITLQSKLTRNEHDPTAVKDAIKWKKQVELLIGCDDKVLFKDVDGGQKVI